MTVTNERELQNFATIEDAHAWARDSVDDNCVSDERFTYLSDPVSMADYAEIRKGGCCGSFDELITVAGYEALVGCNFGH